MRRRSIVLISAALGLMFMVAPALGQWSPGGANNAAGYDGSTLMETPSGGPDPNQPPVYYPYWNNYLDRMQQEGGYYSVTGNYPGSSPVTSYYPASQYSEATSPQSGAGQSNIYYNPSEYYSNQGGTAYQAPQVQSYQAPGATGQAVTGAQQGTPAAGKKRRLKAKRGSGKAQLQATYQQSPYPQSQQVDPQAYAQQQAYQQQLQAYQQQQGYAQQQAGYPQQQQQPASYPQQQAYQQQPGAGAYPASQEASYQQQGYGQTPQQGVQPQAGEAQGQLSSDPIVQAAQQKAYERAVARQRAAELAAQQQAATQELTQAQQQFAMAQQKVKEQEAKQKALQAEYHKKAVGDAYEGLRAAQQRYYELMGVSGESGRPTQTSYQARAVPQAPGQQQALQYPQMAPSQQPQPQAQQQYGQPAPAPQGGGQLQYAGPASAAAGAMPNQPGITPYQAPPGQSTPLRVQGQQQQQAESGGGLWSTLKEIFASPTTGVGPPNQQRSMFEGRGKSRYSD